MASHPKRFFTPREYLALEKDAQYRSEYVNGEIFTMTGATKPHINIVTNLTGSLFNLLKDKDCEVYANQMRVRTPDTTFYTYPNIAVVCGDPVLEDQASATLVNPCLIIEVLSPSTEAYDRTKKFAAYRSIPSLKEYVMVAQSECRVTTYSRHDDGEWRFAEFTNMTDIVNFASIDCALPLEQIYWRVQFPISDDTADNSLSQY